MKVQMAIPLPGQIGSLDTTGMFHDLEKRIYRFALSISLAWRKRESLHLREASVQEG